MALHASWFSPRVGVVLRYDLEAGSTVRFKMEAHNQTGHRLFGASRLSERNPATLSTGAPLPESVRFTWYTHRDPVTYALHDTHKVSHQIPVAERIPAQVIRYATAEKGRAVFLSFRLHDHGVKLAWSVQEMVRHPKGGFGWVYSLHGGDMNCAELGVNPSRCTSTNLKQAPWYLPEWITGQ